MSSNEKILTMRLNRSNVPISNMLKPTDAVKIDYEKSDLVFYLDSSVMDSSVNLNPSFLKLIEKINANIDLDTNRKKLELNEKSIQISMLEEDKNYKMELNKMDLMQKTFEMKKQTADFEYTNKLRDLLLEAISLGDFHKASYLNLCLNNQTDVFNSYFNNNNNIANNNSNFANQNVLNDLTLADNINMMNHLSDEDSLNEDAASSNTNNVNNALNSGIELGEVINVMNDDDEDIENNELDQKNILKSNLTAPSSPLNKVSLANKNIRHLICSTSKLEDYSTNSALTILFKGKCQDSDICHRKESHTHYLIDCTNCRRHISLYFQTSKYGLKFYKTYQIKSQAELDKIIRTFRMKTIRE